MSDTTEIQSEQYLRGLTKTFTGLKHPIKNGKSIETLSELIAELHKVFESDKVNIEYVNHLLLSYKSNYSDWKKFAKFDRYRYTRNLVDAGNGKFNLILLCWGEGHYSAIHDHADSHCFMKMLQGELREIKYEWPEDTAPGDINNNDENDKNIMDYTNCDGEYNKSSLKEISRRGMEVNDVCYINDTIGLHSVENPSNTDGAVSLHLYCPPFDACSIFDKETGKQTKCKVTFWSKYGEKTRVNP